MMPEMAGVRKKKSAEETLPQPEVVASIELDNLYDKFTYHLQFHDSSDPSISRRLQTVNDERLTLLYGSNGSGKTSLLRLLFHGLSFRSRRGHRTHVLRTPFSRLTIHLSGGGSVEYLQTEKPLSDGLILRV